MKDRKVKTMTSSIFNITRMTTHTLSKEVLKRKLISDMDEGIESVCKRIDEETLVKAKKIYEENGSITNEESEKLSKDAIAKKVYRTGLISKAYIVGVDAVVDEEYEKVKNNIDTMLTDLEGKLKNLN